MTKIFYHKLNVFLYFILCLVFFILPLTLIIRKSSEIKLLVYPIILITICGYYYYRIFKAFIHIVIGKPIIEFTSEKYIDNLNGVSIKWKDVQRISLENRKAPFIIFTLKNDSQFYNSLNKFKRTFYRIEAYQGISFRTNISFAKGKNKDILAKIENNYKMSIKRNFN